MKIVIPTADDRGLEAKVSEHFGKASFYTIVNTEIGDVYTEPNRGQHFGGAERPAETIANFETDIVICASLGRRAVRLFQERGIEVFSGARGNVQQVLEDYREGRLTPATEAGACWGHGSGN